MQEKNKKINTKRSIAIATAIASILVVSAVYMSGAWLSKPIPSDDGAANVDENAPYSKARMPPPMRLVDSHGSDVATLDRAKTETGFSQAPSLPTDIPAGLQVGSLRVRTSDNIQENLITVFYVPGEVTASDNDSFESVMTNGGIAIIYSHEPTSKDYDRATWMKLFVDEAPDVRGIRDINGNPAIVVQGNPPLGLTHQVYIYSGDMQVNLVSMKYAPEELAKIAQSIKG